MYIFDCDAPFPKGMLFRSPLWRVMGQKLVGILPAFGLFFGLTSAYLCHSSFMAQGSHFGFDCYLLLACEKRAAQEREMTSDFKIFLASREALMKYKDSRLWKLGESQQNEKGTPMTQVMEKRGHGFFLLTLHHYLFKASQQLKFGRSVHAVKIKLVAVCNGCSLIPRGTGSLSSLPGACERCQQAPPDFDRET